MSDPPEIYLAADAADIPLLKKCLLEGDDVNTHGGEYGTTPLMRACQGRSTPAVRLLLAHGADTNVGDNYQETALHHVAEYNCPHIADLLISKGASVNAVDWLGRTPLMRAAWNNHTELCRVLLERGADCSLQNMVGETALDWAEEANNKAVISLLTDPAVLNWSDLGLTDDGLRKKLLKMKKNVSYTVLLLMNNELENLPNIKQYNCFKDLKVLNLTNNKLKTVNQDNVPGNVEKVYLEGNPLDVYPNFQSHIKLKDATSSVQYIEVVKMEPEKKYSGGVLDCYGCDFTNTELDTQFLDVSDANLYYKLNLSQNKLHEIPDLAKKASFKNLAVLDVSENQIDHVHENAILDKTHLVDIQNNIIEVLSLSKKPKFPRYYNLQGNQIFKVEKLPSGNITLNLQNNPVQYLSKDCVCSQSTYDAIRNALSEDQISNLHQPPPQVFRQGFQAVKSYFRDMEESQQEQQAENSKKRLVFSGPSTAGKSSVVRTLISGSPHVTNIQDRTQVLDIKTWDITNQDVYQIFDQGGHPIYQITNPLFICGEAITFITHNICFTENQLSQTLQDLQRTLYQHPNTEVHFIITHIDELEPDSLTSRLNEYRKSVNTLLQNEISTLSRLKGKVQETDLDNYEKVLTSYQNKQEEFKYFPVSSLNYTGIEDVISFLKDRATAKRVTLPRKWVDCFKKISNCDDNFISLDKYKQIFKKTYGVLESLFTKSSTRQHNGLNCLRYFRDCGLVLWYEEIPYLCEYVFHKIEFLIEVFKSMFHHNLVESLHFQTNPALQVLFTELEYERVIQAYENEGLLNRKLLEYLWEAYNLTQSDQNALITLMKAFTICHEIMNSKELLFFPWFVQDKSIPSGFNPADPMIVELDKFSFHLECIFHNNIPANINEMLVVKLQKLAVTNHYLGDRYAWADGLKVKVSKMEIFVYRYLLNSSVNICIRGKVQNLIQMWAKFEQLYCDIKSLLAQFEGAVKSLRIKCSHCKHKQIDPPYMWLPSEAFPSLKDALLTEITCPFEPEEDIPIGMLTIIRPEDKNSQRLLTDVTAFMEKMSTLDECTSKSEMTIENTREKEMAEELENIIHPQPLLTELYAANLLSVDDKQELEALTITKQCHSLLTRFVVRGDSETRDKFVTALNATQYHTNITAGRMLNSVFDNMEWTQELITHVQRDQMKGNCYKTLQQHIVPDELISPLYTDGTIDQYHYEELDAKPTTLKKATYLLESVLFRGTFDTVNRFRDALIKCNQPELAELLPKRTTDGETPEKDDGRPRSERAGKTPHKDDDTQISASKTGTAQTVNKENAEGRDVTRNVVEDSGSTHFKKLLEKWNK